MKRILLYTLLVGLAAHPGISRADDDPPSKTPDTGHKTERTGRTHAFDLTDAQKQSMRELRFKNQRQMIALRAKLADARLSLQELMSADKIDQAAVHQQAGLLAEAQSQVMRAQIENRAAMMGLLTLEQRRAMRSRAGGAGMRMRGGMGSGGMRGQGPGMGRGMGMGGGMGDGKVRTMIRRYRIGGMDGSGPAGWGSMGSNFGQGDEGFGVPGDADDLDGPDGLLDLGGVDDGSE